MTPIDTSPHEPEDAEVRYDLAGNPLPSLPKEAVPIPVPGMHFAPPPSADSPAPKGFTPPSGFTPPPRFTPPGASLHYAPAPAVKTPAGLTLYLSLGGGFLVLLGLIFGVQALKPKRVALPTAYKTYTAIDNSFSCDQPALWTLHETGATSGNLATATFEDGHARVRVVSDATGSLMGDIVGAGNANLPPEQQVPAVQKLHVMDQKQLAASLEGYKEGDIQKFQSAVGDARVSEWTASGGLGAGSLHGYRVTMLGREREFTVICFCPERDWKTLMPAFQRMISSVKPGSPS